MFFFDYWVLNPLFFTMGLHILTFLPPIGLHTVLEKFFVNSVYSYKPAFLQSVSLLPDI